MKPVASPSNPIQFENSDVPNEVPHATFEGFGNPCQGFQGYFLFGPLNVPNVIARQFGFFGQLFLAQMRFLPLGADGFPQYTINSARR